MTTSDNNDRPEDEVRTGAFAPPTEGVDTGQQRTQPGPTDEQLAAGGGTDLDPDDQSDQEIYAEDDDSQV